MSAPCWPCGRAAPTRREVQRHVHRKGKSALHGRARVRKPESGRWDSSVRSACGAASTGSCRAARRCATASCTWRRRSASAPRMPEARRARGSRWTPSRARAQRAQARPHVGTRHSANRRCFRGTRLRGQRSACRCRARSCTCRSRGRATSSLRRSSRRLRSTRRHCTASPASHFPCTTRHSSSGARRECGAASHPGRQTRSAGGWDRRG
mmetsp:Transcript_42263/g.137159  ORF Transcript_42263/g.137159 Transcript_42263/m.137159 type:complete len:210 (-) Transcript_42263:980-1609(-)